jgi:hypothetical protein
LQIKGEPFSAPPFYSSEGQKRVINRQGRGSTGGAGD